jgi:YD repeat-containing protein
LARNASNAYSYVNASRLSVVSDGTNSATYSYLANSPFVSQILFKQAASTRMTTTQQYDYLNRLQQISAVPGGGQLGTLYGYQYNAANQRTVATLGDNSQWKYGYDNLGQVISGKKNWSNQSAVPSEQFEYTFDDIGNRTATKMGGDSAGLNLRSATYSPNTLNEYTSRSVPASFDVIGIVNGAATVTVNGQTPYRKGEFFDSVVTVNNASAPLYQAVTVSSTHGVNNGSQTGSVYIPPATESYGYDLDGNPIEENGGMNVYGFVFNFPIQFDDSKGLALPALPPSSMIICPGCDPDSLFPQEPDDSNDILIQNGVVPRCHVVIYIGHNRAKSPRLPSRIINSPCSAGSAIGCFSAGVPVQTPTPGIPERPDPNTKVNPYQAAALAEKDWSASIALAKAALSKGNNCCKQITVQVECSGLEWYERNFNPLGAICGRKAVIR